LRTEECRGAAEEETETERGGEVTVAPMDVRRFDTRTLEAVGGDKGIMGQYALACGRLVRREWMMVSALLGLGGGRRELSSSRRRAAGA
jgi:hypothetical protein